MIEKVLLKIIKTKRVVLVKDRKGFNKCIEGGIKPTDDKTDEIIILNWSVNCCKLVIQYFGTLKIFIAHVGSLTYALELSFDMENPWFGLRGKSGC